MFSLIEELRMVRSLDKTERERFLHLLTSNINSQTSLRRFEQWLQEKQSLREERATLREEQDFLRTERETLRRERGELEDEREEIRRSRMSLEQERDQIRREQDREAGGWAKSYNW